MSDCSTLSTRATRDARCGSLIVIAIVVVIEMVKVIVIVIAIGFCSIRKETWANESHRGCPPFRSEACDNIAGFIVSCVVALLFYCLFD